MLKTTRRHPTHHVSNGNSPRLATRQHYGASSVRRALRFPSILVLLGICLLFVLLIGIYHVVLTASIVDQAHTTTTQYTNKQSSFISTQNGNLRQAVHIRKENATVVKSHQKLMTTGQDAKGMKRKVFDVPPPTVASEISNSARGQRDRVRNQAKEKGEYARKTSVLDTDFIMDNTNNQPKVHEEHDSNQVPRVHGQNDQQTALSSDSTVNSIEKPTRRNNQRTRRSNPDDSTSNGRENVQDEEYQQLNPSDPIEKHKRREAVENVKEDVKPATTKPQEATLPAVTSMKNPNNATVAKLTIDPILASQQARILARRKKEGKPCLSFMHIPKTGGTTIEDAAFPFGVKWGFRLWRHEQITTAIRKLNTGKKQPSLHPYKNSTWDKKDVGPLWHAPISLFDKKRSKLPYKNCHLFAIVRNPYSRWVSRYNSLWSGYDGPDGDNPENFDKWVNEELDLIEHKVKVLTAHKAPQWVHYYDQHSGERLDYIKHTLHFEELFQQKNATTFNNLMEEYGLMMRLNMTTTPHTQKGFTGARKRFTPLTLPQETRDRIYRVYQKDFELFGYSRDWGK